MKLSAATVTRYVAPLREGGSLPGLVEADDLGIYVCKFRGAGQGLPVLVAEVIVAGLALRLGLRTPRLAVLDLSAEIARYEGDEEVQDLLAASVGSNLGVDFLPGAFGFDATTRVPADFAAKVLLLDAFVANVDRSWRNPNMLVWHREPWVIDHGASLYFHHSWSGGVGSPERFARQPWSARDHVFERHAAAAREHAEDLAALLDDQVLVEVLDQVPEEWLAAPEHRAAYVDFLKARRDGVEGERAWLP